MGHGIRSAASVARGSRLANPHSPVPFRLRQQRKPHCLRRSTHYGHGGRPSKPSLASWFPFPLRLDNALAGYQASSRELPQKQGWKPRCSCGAGAARRGAGIVQCKHTLQTKHGALIKAASRSETMARDRLTSFRGCWTALEMACVAGASKVQAAGIALSVTCCPTLGLQASRLQHELWAELGKETELVQVQFTHAFGLGKILPWMSFVFESAWRSCSARHAVELLPSHVRSVGTRPPYCLASQACSQLCMRMGSVTSDLSSRTNIGGDDMPLSWAGLSSGSKLPNLACRATRVLVSLCKTWAPSKLVSSGCGCMWARPWSSRSTVRWGALEPEPVEPVDGECIASSFMA